MALKQKTKSVIAQGKNSGHDVLGTLKALSLSIHKYMLKCKGAEFIGSRSDHLPDNSGLYIELMYSPALSILELSIVIGYSNGYYLHIIDKSRTMKSSLAFCSTMKALGVNISQKAKSAGVEVDYTMGSYFVKYVSTKESEFKDTVLKELFKRK